MTFFRQHAENGSGALKMRAYAVPSSLTVAYLVQMFTIFEALSSLPIRFNDMVYRYNGLSCLYLQNDHNVNAWNQTYPISNKTLFH
jgi:hypothetical protein